MKLFIFSVFAFFNLSFQSPLGHWTLEPHTLVVEVDGTAGQLPLSCMTSSEAMDSGSYKLEEIIWTKDGVEEEQRGNMYVVPLLESFGGGNYTCYSSDGSVLNHTVVLIHEDETKRKKILVRHGQGPYLMCSAQNYNGQFHCSWSWHSSRIGKVALIKAGRVSDTGETQCSVDPSGKSWVCTSGLSRIICSVDDSGHGILCVDQQHCPYAEEIQPVHVTVFVSSDSFLLENYSTLFLLSEIVRPDKVQISNFNSTMIEWSYPTSWSSPFSYFPLTFQIAQLKSHSNGCENPCNDLSAAKLLTIHPPHTCQFQVKRRTKSVCIRAKDALCNSQWSDWSHFRVKRGRKDKRRPKRA